MAFEVIKYNWAQKLIVKVLGKFGSNKLKKFITKHTYDSTSFLKALRECLNEALTNYAAKFNNQLESELMEYFQGKRTKDQLSSITIPFKREVSELMAKKYPAYKLVMDADLDSQNFSTLNRKIDKLYEILNVKKNYSIAFSFEDGDNEVKIFPSYTLVTYFHKDDEPVKITDGAMSKAAYDAAIKGQTLPAYIAELESQQLKISKFRPITQEINHAFMPIKFSLANLSYDTTFPAGYVFIHFPDFVELDYTNVKDSFRSLVLNPTSNTFINKDEHYVRFDFKDLNPQLYTSSEDVFIRIPANNHNTLKITLKWEISAHDFSRCGELFIISTPNIEKHKEVHVKRQIEGGRECKFVDYIERK